MTKRIEPRMEKVLTYQLRAVFVNAVLAMLVGFWLAYDAFDFSFLALFSALILTFILNKVFNFVTLTFFQLRMYGSDISTMIEDAQNASEVINAHVAASKEIDPEAEAIKKITVEIVNTPETPLGRFMDTEFFDWIEVKGHEGKVTRCTFLGTVDLSKGVTIPDGCLLLPPGLIYQVEGI